MNISQLDDELLPTARSLKHVTSQMKNLYRTYQSKTSILDSTLDTLHEELDNVQINAEKVFIQRTEEILRSKQTFNSPIPTTSYNTSTTPLTHQRTNVSTHEQRQRTNRHTPERSSNHHHQPMESPYRGVKTDIIRKMVKLSCTDSDQLLDFYTKLRTAMMQAGIFLREIQEIHEDDPIYEEKDGYTSDDYRTQGNALYTFLCNEDVIPQDFTFAQNCLKSITTTMDGFQTLKSMLVLVHPSLNKRRPPNNPPVYSETGDLHLYEQSLRNYFLLHEIYGRSTFTELDKSKQFIEGLDCDDFDNEKSRLMAILDTVELNSLVLTPKHTLQHLATTIMNMGHHSPARNVQVNAFQGRQNYGSRQNMYNQYRSSNSRTNNNSTSRIGHNKFACNSTGGKYRTNKFSNTNGAKPKFERIQCNACKLYGHNVRNCRLIATHLAMADFSKQNQMVCKKILENHIAINTEDHKRTIVRTMQLTGVLDDEEDSDSFLDMEEIIHTPIVNKIETTAPLSNNNEE